MHEKGNKHNLNVSGDLSLHGDLSVISDITCTKNVNANSLNVGDILSVNNEDTNSTIINSGLTVYGDVNIDGGIKTNDSVYINDTNRFGILPTTNPIPAPEKNINSINVFDGSPLSKIPHINSNYKALYALIKCLDFDGKLLMYLSHNGGLYLYEKETDEPNSIVASRPSIILSRTGLIQGKSISITNSNDTSVFSVNNNGECAANAFYQKSDSRLKDFGEKILVDFDKLKALKKNYFTWKDGNKGTQIGVSAQEIQDIYPELVNTDENGTLSVAYDKLSVVALAAVDNLHEENEALEKRIKDLEDKFEALLSRINY